MKRINKAVKGKICELCIIFAVILIVASLFYVLGRIHGARDLGTDSRLLNVYDQQRELVRRGHPIKIDGKMCKGWNVPGHSETLEALEKECGDQRGIELYEFTFGEEND